eukprot:10090255-Alexandrium_andersonii.AAC.1
MSASLVGSEMCIRDRPRVSRLLRRIELFADHPTKACRRGSARTGPRPVSYTHLTLPTICSV